MPALENQELLLIPGPTPVPQSVMDAIARPMIGHRSKDFSAMLRDATNGLKWLADTERDPLILTASGTGAMEAAIANTISPGDRVLSLVCGVFSERWAKLCEAYGANVERLSFAHGTAYDRQTIIDYLTRAGRENRHFKAVTITHNETSTAVINDLADTVDLVRGHGALSIVDAVTSFGAVPINIDKIGMDVLVVGSQKALMLPPGLSVVFMSERAWQATAECRSPRYYFDLNKARKSLETDTTPFTPSVPLVRGLQASLQIMQDEGKEEIFERHRRLQYGLRTGLRAMGLHLFVEDDCASPTVTAVLPPQSISVDSIRAALKKDFKIIVADGQDALKGKIFRVGHMGYVTDRTILKVVSALSVVLTELGMSVQREPVERAAKAALAR